MIKSWPLCRQNGRVLLADETMEVIFDISTASTDAVYNAAQALAESLEASNGTFAVGVPL